MSASEAKRPTTTASFILSVTSDGEECALVLIDKETDDYLFIATLPESVANLQRFRRAAVRIPLAVAVYLHELWGKGEQQEAIEIVNKVITLAFVY